MKSFLYQSIGNIYIILYAILHFYIKNALILISYVILYTSRLKSNLIEHFLQIFIIFVNVTKGYFTLHFKCRLYLLGIKSINSILECLSIAFRYSNVDDTRFDGNCVFFKQNLGVERILSD